MCGNHHLIGFPTGARRAYAYQKVNPLLLASLGGYLLLAPGVSTVRYPIPQRAFRYVATVQSVTDETCHNRILLVDPTLIDPEMQDCNP